MKVELHDNAREAFQFLTLGAAIILAVRLLGLAFGLWNTDISDDALAHACAPFRNGYPLIGKYTLVVGGLPMIPRSAVAALFVLFTGLLLALLALPFGMLVKWGGLRSAVFGGRVGLLLGSTWSIYALLCIPPRSVEVSTSGLHVHHKPAFLAVIALPFPGHEHLWEWSEVNELTLRTTSLKGVGSTSYVDVDAAVGRTGFTVARTSEQADDGPELGEQKENAKRLLIQLRKLRGY